MMIKMGKDELSSRSGRSQPIPIMVRFLRVEILVNQLGMVQISCSY